MRRLLSSLLVLSALPALAQASHSGVAGGTAGGASGSIAGGVLGDWQEPGGSILQVLPCGSDVCMRIMTLRPNTPHFNAHDPDPAKRGELLCGLRIGYGFQPQGADKATSGQVYDPQSGKTYRGEMHSEGDTLHLRGYILIPAFGRTEQWKRVPPVEAPCNAH